MSGGENPAALLEGLVDALQLAAIPAAEQVDPLPDFVHVPDEIALLCDEAFGLVPQIREAGLIEDDRDECRRALGEKPSDRRQIE